jgi:hypothetical protein
MCAAKTEYDPKPPKTVYLFGSDFFEDTKEQEAAEREQAFKNYLRYLADGNTKVYARRRAGLTDSILDTKRRNSSEFAGLEARALEDGCDCIEQEAIRRGRDGVEKDVYYKGEIVGTEIVYSDSLLLSVLKSKKPEYRESRNVVTAEINSTVQEKPVVDTTKLSEEQLLQLEELLMLGANND